MGGRIENAIWDERREWLEKHRRSGCSAAGFCREHGLNLSNFHAWKRKLQGAAPVKWRLRGKPAGQAEDLLSSAFLQVPVPVAARAASGASWIEVCLAEGMVVRVPATNLPALQVVLSALNPCRESTDA